MAEDADNSIVKASDTPAHIETTYRFIINEKVPPQAIANSGFSQTNEVVKPLPLVPAIQDTTGLTFKHSVCKELGDVRCENTLRKPSKTRALYAHSNLAIDADTEHAVGLLNRAYGFRKTKV